MTHPNPAYLTAVLEIFPATGTSLVVDLARPVAPQQREALRALLGGPFAVVTACNPNGHTADAAENARRTAGLEAELTRRGCSFVRADGRSPDGAHRERGVAVAMSLTAARNLARTYQQEAYYWFDGDSFWLLGALEEMARKLPTRHS